MAAATVATAADVTLKAGVFNPPRMAPEFALLGSDGASLSLSRYRGKVVALAFGYTHCPSVCPVTLATLAQAHKLLGAQASEFQVVYVTVDPVRDDATRMKQYLAAVDSSFIGGTGSDATLQSVRDHYGILASTRNTPGSSEPIAHSSFVYLIDRRGQLQALMPYGSSAADYAHDLRILIGR